jgi:hypothetical protein
LNALALVARSLNAFTPDARTLNAPAVGASTPVLSHRKDSGFRPAGGGQQSINCLSSTLLGCRHI